MDLELLLEVNNKKYKSPHLAILEILVLSETGARIGEILPPEALPNIDATLKAILFFEIAFGSLIVLICIRKILMYVFGSRYD